MLSPENRDGTLAGPWCTANLSVEGAQLDPTVSSSQPSGFRNPQFTVDVGMGAEVLLSPDASPTPEAASPLSKS